MELIQPWMVDRLGRLKSGRIAWQLSFVNTQMKVKPKKSQAHCVTLCSLVLGKVVLGCTEVQWRTYRKLYIKNLLIKFTMSWHFTLAYFGFFYPLPPHHHQKLIYIIKITQPPLPRHLLHDLNHIHLHGNTVTSNTRFNPCLSISFYCSPFEFASPKVKNSFRLFWNKPFLFLFCLRQTSWLTKFSTEAPPREKSPWTQENIMALVLLTDCSRSTCRTFLRRFSSHWTTPHSRHAQRWITPGRSCFCLNHTRRRLQNCWWRNWSSRRICGRPLKRETPRK